MSLEPRGHGTESEVHGLGNPQPPRPSPDVIPRLCRCCRFSSLPPGSEVATNDWVGRWRPRASARGGPCLALISTVGRLTTRQWVRLTKTRCLRDLTPQGKGKNRHSRARRRSHHNSHAGLPRDESQPRPAASLPSTLGAQSRRAPSHARELQCWLAAYTPRIWK